MDDISFEVNEEALSYIQNLKNELDSAYSLIEEKENEVQLAASIGQNLLESNKALQEQISAYEKRIEDLDNDKEQEIQGIQEQLKIAEMNALRDGEQADLLIAKLQEQVADYEKIPEKDDSELLSRLQALFEENEELRISTKKLEKEKRAVQEHFEQLNENRERDCKEKDNVIGALQKEIGKLNEDLQAQANKLSHEISLLKECQCEREGLQARVEELQQGQEDADLLKMQLVTVRSEAEQLAASLEEARAFIVDLEESFDLQQSSLAATADSSLWTEVDDRRKEAESSYSQLMDRHTEVQRAHELERLQRLRDQTLSQKMQARLKRRILQLQKNSRGGASHEEMDSLREGLSQATATLEETQAKMRVLEGERDRAVRALSLSFMAAKPNTLKAKTHAHTHTPSQGPGLAEGAGPDRYVVYLLEEKEVLEKNNEQLRAENKSKSLFLASETTKLRKLERELFQAQSRIEEMCAYKREMEFTQEQHLAQIKQLKARVKKAVAAGYMEPADDEAASAEADTTTNARTGQTHGASPTTGPPARGRKRTFGEIVQDVAATTEPKGKSNPPLVGKDGAAVPKEDQEPNPGPVLLTATVESTNKENSRENDDGVECGKATITEEAEMQREVEAEIAVKATRVKHGPKENCAQQ